MSDIKPQLNAEQYDSLYKHSIEAPATFWSNQALQFISWFSPWTSVIDGDFTQLNVNWFNNGQLNACYNCVDRHLTLRRDQVAIIWEGNDPQETLSITYGQLHEKICRLANLLKVNGIEKGDRVCIYLPMIPEAVIAMLACARIGAIHSVVFGGFSAEALKTRILDSGCRLLITADEGLRGEKTIPLKEQADIALNDCPNVNTVIVVKRTGKHINWLATRDIWYHDAINEMSDECPAEYMDANDPLFILYTSGSTGKPKGVLHTTGGYMVYTAMTYHYIFDYQNRENNIHFCTADVGWITGHSYLVYGPLANGATTLLFEGIPTYPTYSRLWNIVDKHLVSSFYTAPTAIRALRQEGDNWVTQTSRKSLTLLGTVGEPINPDAWEWYENVVGDHHCSVVNTWWQTETGGVMLTPFPGFSAHAPGSAGIPFFGVVPEIVDDEGNPLPDNQVGNLIINQPWPGLMQTIYNDHNKFIDSYFKPIPGRYLTGDGAYRDANGNFWITGRNDDVINVSGHRIGSGELESALGTHDAVSESAVVGYPHAIKGEGIFAFVTLKNSSTPSEHLKKELIQCVRDKIGPLATPDGIQWTIALPKTRSGKIMRRILRKIANKEFDRLGDISTLADANVIEKIIADRNIK